VIGTILRFEFSKQMAKIGEYGYECFIILFMCG
jgi:hypothetical protein